MTDDGCSRRNGMGLYSYLNFHQEIDWSSSHGAAAQHLFFTVLLGTALQCNSGQMV
jgi:hypothetical protein